MTEARTPPGRSARLHLAQRLSTARRAADLLERKRRVLLREQRRLAQVLEGTGVAWADSCARAQRWSVRALVIGDRDEVRRSLAVQPAQAEVTWQTRMGVTYPATAATRLPAVVTGGSAAYPPAVEACGQALRDGVAHAAALAAYQRVDDELERTQRRLRAIRNRWIPRLEAQLHGLDVSLDQAEREELTRLRWSRPATPRSSGRDGPGRLASPPDRTGGLP